MGPGATHHCGLANLYPGGVRQGRAGDGAAHGGDWHPRARDCTGGGSGDAGAAFAGDEHLATRGGAELSRVEQAVHDAAHRDLPRHADRRELYRDGLGESGLDGAGYGVGRLRLDGAAAPALFGTRGVGEVAIARDGVCDRNPDGGDGDFRVAGGAILRCTEPQARGYDPGAGAFVYGLFVDARVGLVGVGHVSDGSGREFNACADPRVCGDVPGAMGAG